ncbi:hypothetical protein K443DRAFT_112538 [Laccaria amethystina LaAM-08-1]|uniref:Shieldin complex subunit 2 first OB fold domain-containing protein n=1 Tax=Laccaria amethystina LaAM-08-1 TaxID=1095629 RepID=A0A0C9WWD8_9AGAR|nr:hypothetical protein K443DRAFT_112538 [Laccaria amethystina LaAM-08-1]
MPYRIFLGAPSPQDLANIDSSAASAYHWQTVSSSSRIPSKSSSTRLIETQSLILPPATLEAASRRISLIYQNIIFDESKDEEGDSLVEEDDLRDGNESRKLGDQTTLITWPPTAESRRDKSKDAPSFLLNSLSQRAATKSQYPETQDESGFDDSIGYSDASSIAHFPTFHFNLHDVTPLAHLVGVKSRKVLLVVVAILEVEGPDSIRIKKGPDAGKEISILKVILGDEAGTVCKLTAWREVAETWGGDMKRGDVVFIESPYTLFVYDRPLTHRTGADVTATSVPNTSPTLTASPNLKSTMTICYRTMPYSHEHNRLRPDLRLGDSDPCVRKVAAAVRWFEKMAGLPSKA